jgi:CheY-like chemotaxis protein
LEYLLRRDPGRDVVARRMASRSANSLSASERFFGDQMKGMIALAKDDRLTRSAKGVLKILTVDDDPAIAACLSFVLKSPRYQLTSARNGREALARLSAAEEPYDIIITDNQMPQLSGVELVQALREQNFAGKIMVLSGQLTPESRDAFTRMKVDAILDKPFDNYELRNRLDLLTAASES